MLFAVVLNSDYYIRKILASITEITEKARKIASGSYGVQIQNHYDDELGDLAEMINEMSSQISRNEKMQGIHRYGRYAVCLLHLPHRVGGITGQIAERM